MVVMIRPVIKRYSWPRQVENGCDKSSEWQMYIRVHPSIHPINAVYTVLTNIDISEIRIWSCLPIDLR
jgi:hypothetical protein